MKLITSIKKMREISRNWKSGAKIGFVPTMGFLHPGHISLIEASKKTCDITVVSDFVNPTQFGEGEDFGMYPRDLNLDVALVTAHEVDYLFAPKASEMFPQRHRTWVIVEQLIDTLESENRPGHFMGVCTVVLKLMNIVKPTAMFMGEKDFQQLVIVRKMVKDLNLDCEVIGCPTVREIDGLALSSRNWYLGSEERKIANCLYESLQLAQSMYARGEKDSFLIGLKVIELVKTRGADVDFVDFISPETLGSVYRLTDNTRLFLAVYLGKTRLIDNAPMKP